MAIVAPCVMSISRQEKILKKEKVGFRDFFLHFIGQSWVAWLPLTAREARRSGSYFYSLYSRGRQQ